MTDGGDADLRWPLLGNVQEALMDYLLDAHCLLGLDSWMMDLRESASSRSPRVAFFENYYEKDSQRFLQPRRRLCNHLRVARIRVDKVVLRTVP